jgi:hypothetical protein
MLGQEKFSKAKTRHLGTVEALLLLSEWYPQALHFHSEVDGWDSDLMYTAPSRLDPPPTEGSPMQSRWKEDVVEPTRQSDRMSWMLVSSALALAHELGVFDSRLLWRQRRPRCKSGRAKLPPAAELQAAAPPFDVIRDFEYTVLANRLHVPHATQLQPRKAHH